MQKGDENLNRSYSVRPLTEGAMMAGIFVLMAIITYYTTAIGTLVLFAMSAPSAILTYRQGWKTGLLSATASILVLLLLVDPIFVITGCISLQFTGLALGFALRQGYQPWLAVAITAIAFLIGFFFLIQMGSLLMDVNFNEEMISIYREAAKTSIELAERFNVPEEQTSIITQLPDMIEVFFTTLFPMLITLSSLANALINYQVVVILGRRLNLKVEPLPPFQNWRLPELFGLFYMLAFFLNYLGKNNGIEFLTLAADNIYQLFYILMQVQGLTIITWYLIRFKVNPAFRWLLLIFVYFNPYLATLVLILGFLDLILDFRRLGMRYQDI